MLFLHGYFNQITGVQVELLIPLIYIPGYIDLKPSSDKKYRSESPPLAFNTNITFNIFLIQIHLDACAADDFLKCNFSFCHNIFNSIQIQNFFIFLPKCFQSLLYVGKGYDSKLQNQAEIYILFFNSFSEAKSPGLLAQHKSSLDRLKDQDLEFYEFLQKEDKSLLDFGKYRCLVLTLSHIYA